MQQTTFEQRFHNAVQTRIDVLSRQIQAIVLNDSLYQLYGMSSLIFPQFPTHNGSFYLQLVTSYNGSLSFYYCYYCTTLRGKLGKE